MPLWLSILLFKVALPIVLGYLQKSGIINSVESAGIKDGTHILSAVKVEDTYPKDKSGGA